MWGMQGSWKLRWHYKLHMEDKMLTLTRNTKMEEQGFSASLPCLYSLLPQNMKTVSMCICRHASCHITEDLNPLTHLQCDLMYMAYLLITLCIKSGLKIYVIFFLQVLKARYEYLTCMSMWLLLMNFLIHWDHRKFLFVSKYKTRESNGNI